MLENSPPILVCYIYYANVGIYSSNMAILFSNTNVGKTGLEQWDAALKCKDDAGNLLQHWNSTLD